MSGTKFNIPEPYWNDFAVAEYFSVHVSKIRRWRREQKGPTWARFGGAIRYKPADVISWADKQANEPKMTPRTLWTNAAELQIQTDTEPPESGAAPVEYSAG